MVIVGVTHDGPPHRQLTRYRAIVQPAVDATAWVVALTVSSLLRWTPHDGYLVHARFAVALVVAVTVQVIVGFADVLYRIRWQVGSFEEMAALTRTVIVTTL